MVESLSKKEKLKAAEKQLFGEKKPVTAANSKKTGYQSRLKLPENNVETSDYTFKIIIIGNPTCGKTSLLLRAAEGKRNETYEVTVGVDCKSRTFDYKGSDGIKKRVKLQFWDTAGQERFT